MVYRHEFGDEAVKEYEILKGIRKREETISTAQVELQPKYCPICHESNKYNAKFCLKCNFTISIEGAIENRDKESLALKESESQEQELVEVKARMVLLEENASNLLRVVAGITNEVVINTWTDKQGLLQARFA